MVAGFTRSLAPGSYMIISVGFGKGRAGQEFASTYNAQDGSRIYAHSWEDISAMFDGLELVPPGIVDCASWGAEPPAWGTGGPDLDDPGRRRPPPLSFPGCTARPGRTDDLASALQS